MKKMDKRIKTISISILIVTALIAIMDIIFYKSLLFGTESQYLVGDYMIGTWDLFSKLGIGLILIFSFLYYFYYHRDISETISIALGSYFLWMYAGISDGFFFLFQLKPIPDLPWLNGHQFVGTIANIMGNNVTAFSLIISILVGSAIVYYLIKILRFRF